MPFLDAHGVLPEFELRKDLLRLRKATSEAERVKILERLLYYPECCDLDFLKIAKDYVKNLETLKALNDRREAWDNRNAISEIK